MLPNRLAFVALAVACVAAAAGGGYLASRQNTTTVPVAAAPAASAAPSSVTPEKPVQETEAIVGDSQGIPHAPADTERVEAPPRAAAHATKSAVVSNVRHETSARQSHAGRPAAAPPQPPTPPNTPAALDPTMPPSSIPRQDDRATPEPPRALEPQARMLEELVVPADSVIGLQTERTISSDRARVEDRVDARVTRDVRVGDKVAIPAGTHAIGSVMQVERGGKFKERAHLSVRFHTLVLGDGTSVPISTDTIYRDGEAPNSAQKIGGGAVAGTILGAIFGGAKGAAIGGAAGAGAGAAVTAAGDRSAATLLAGTSVTARILSPVAVTIEQK